jgi:hypothetical protein
MYLHNKVGIVAVFELRHTERETDRQTDRKRDGKRERETDG